MKYNYIRMNQLIVMLLVASIVWSFQAGIAHSNVIIGTAEWVDNLNPFTYTAYPAELIVQFTTERLIQQICTGIEEKEKSYRAIVHQPCIQTIGQDYKPNESKFYLNLKSNTIITTHDIQFTLKQIEYSLMNRYHDHEMKFIPDLIEIMNPRQANFSNAAKALTFPIIRNVLENNQTILDYQSHVSSNDHIKAYNKATTGTYRLDSRQEKQTRLSSRHGEQSVIPLTFNFEDRWQLFFENLLSKKFHVGLSVNGALMKDLSKMGTYQLKETDDLNSFTYFGFNYKSQNTMVKQLFSQKSEFRQAFAFAVASQKDIRNCLMMYGNSMNNTFDAMRSIEGKSPPIRYSGNSKFKIYRYIKALDVSQNTTLRLLFRSDLIFSIDIMQKLVEYLNNMFSSANIRFKLLSAPIASVFNDHKSSNNFEIIFDTFVYGQNKLRYIEFMNPDSPVNYLGYDRFKANEIKMYKQEIEQRDNFLMRINNELPVFVLGRFRSLNALSTRIQPTESICKKSRMMPFTDIQSWRINPPQPTNPQEGR